MAPIEKLAAEKFAASGIGTVGQINIVPHGEIFEVTKRPARLKVEV